MKANKGTHYSNLLLRAPLAASSSWVSALKNTSGTGTHDGFWRNIRGNAQERDLQLEFTLRIGVRISARLDPNRDD
jgi:hypothetical protein